MFCCSTSNQTTRQDFKQGSKIFIHLFFNKTSPLYCSDDQQIREFLAKACEKKPRMLSHDPHQSFRAMRNKGKAAEFVMFFNEKVRLRSV